MKGHGFRIVVLRVYEGDDEKLAHHGAALSFTGYHSNAGLPEHRLVYDDEPIPKPSDDAGIVPHGGPCRMKVCLDWDGTLVDALTQEWLPDAEWALGRMIQAGWKVTVLSCRASWPEGRASIEAKLDGSRLSAVDVTDVKPDADVYVDDRALRFGGDWSDVFAEIREVA